MSAVSDEQDDDDAVAESSPDLTLVRAFPWEELYRRHYAPMVRLAGLLSGDYQAGEEVAQEAFARMLESPAHLREPVAYLRGTVVKLCRMRIRRAVVARRYRAERLVPVAGPEEGSSVAFEQRALCDALRRLPQRQREAIVLRFYGQMTEPEVAAVMGVSIGTVKTHVHRGLASLTQDLEGLR